MQVVAVISGGNLVGVFASDPEIEVCVIDWDNINEGDTGSWIQPDPLEAMPGETREVFDTAGR
jgi:hypothetical protein